MRRFCLCAIVLPCLLLSCPRQKESVDTSALQPEPQLLAPPLAAPLAIVQAGEYPLWFQLGADGPVLIETIEDAVFSAALVPWPLAPHVRFMLAQGEDLLMAVNRDGFLRFSPWGQGGAGNPSTGLYRFTGGNPAAHGRPDWRQYTVGAFFLLGEKPAALLYLDDRFFDSDAPLPSPRLWTFDRRSTELQALALPALNVFAPEDGWDIDALRRGGDGAWYFRAMKKTAPPELRMLRTPDLMQEGESVSLGAFQNAALPEALSAAPPALQEILAAVFTASGSGIVAIVSPEFQTTRSFAIDRNKPAIVGFFRGGRAHLPDSTPFLLAFSSQGNAWYAQTVAAAEAPPSIHQFSLPALPEGFVYTGIGMCEDTIIASWEEQAGYSIGAAGFMVIKHSLPLSK